MNQLRYRVLGLFMSTHFQSCPFLYNIFLSNAWEQQLVRLLSALYDVSWVNPTWVNPLKKKKLKEHCTWFYPQKNQFSRPPVSLSLNFFHPSHPPLPLITTIHHRRQQYPVATKRRRAPRRSYGAPTQTSGGHHHQFISLSQTAGNHNPVPRPPRSSSAATHLGFFSCKKIF